MKARSPFVGIAMLLLLGGCFAGPGYQGDPSDHFDGEVFHNRIPADKDLWDIMGLGLRSLTQAADWPEWIEEAPGELPPAGAGIRVTFINHSTFLLQIGEVTVLTDPIYGRRASPLTWAGPERVRAPGIPLEDLPPIDVVLLSHDHYDHLDLETLQGLQDRGRDGGPPVVLAGLGVGALLEENGIAAHRDLDWEDAVEVAGLRFIFTECRHRSGRGLSDQMETLWGSFVIEAPEGSIYFAGDTGFGPHFAETGARHGPFDLALLPIGAYEPRDFMAAVHLNPAEAVQAHLDLGSEQSVGMHFGTFQLTFEGIDEPAQDLALALAERGVDAEAFWVLGFGESRALESAGGEHGGPSLDSVPRDPLGR